jgi:hypothetical protein
MPNLIKLLEHLSFRNPAPKTEIHRLIEKHGLALEAVGCSHCTKTIGLLIKGERTICSLWRTNANRSVRKVKKALKRFLREYDRQHRPMVRQKPTLHELLRKFAALRGLPIEEKPKGLACRMSDKTILTLFHRPVMHGRFTFYGMSTDLSKKYLRDKCFDKDMVEYLRKKLEESIEILELRAKIMDPEKLETAERMAKKRRKLQEVYDLLSSYQTIAEIKVTAKLPYAEGDKVKEAVISEDTFNALVCKLAEDEINRINEFVKSL